MDIFDKIKDTINKNNDLVVWIGKDYVLDEYFLYIREHKARVSPWEIKTLLAAVDSVLVAANNGNETELVRLIADQIKAIIFSVIIDELGIVTSRKITSNKELITLLIQREIGDSENFNLEITDEKIVISYLNNPLGVVNLTTLDCRGAFSEIFQNQIKFLKENF